MPESKTITLTYSQFWSVLSGLATAVFVLTMIFARFLSTEATIKVLSERGEKKHARQQIQIDSQQKQIDKINESNK